MTGNQFQFPPCWPSRNDGKQHQFVAYIFEAGESEKTEILNVINTAGVAVESQSYYEQPRSCRLLFQTSTNCAWHLFQTLLSHASNLQVDILVRPADMPDVRLLVCDMDSTVVTSESLDDMAFKAGVGERIQAITTRAMRGDIDFIGALTERVRLLKGVNASLLYEVAAEIKLSSGAEALMANANNHGMRTVLVSGGFEPIVAHVADLLGFDRFVCNYIGVTDGKLDGNVIGPVVDADAKLRVLTEECERMGIATSRACAIGDGANDLPMLQSSGIGISYKGKPLLRSGLVYQVNYSDLASVAAMLDISRAQD